MNRTVLILLILCALGAFAYKVYKVIPNYFEVKEIEQFVSSPKQKFACKECWVTGPDTFDFLLQNGKVIQAKLSVSVPKKAEQDVISMFHLADKKSPPQVTLIENKGDYWVVDVLLVINGKETDLATLLKEKGLIYNNEF